MKKLILTIIDFFNNGLWDTFNEAERTAKKCLRRTLQAAVKLVYEIQSGQLATRSQSLVYITILSFVPLIAVAFSLLKAFGFHNMVQPFLVNLLDPLGDKGEEIALTIVKYVNNIKVGVLGTAGLAALLYTAMSTVQKIESAFNYAWQVKEGRKFLKRVRDYLAVLLIGPVLMTTAVGMTTTLMNSSVAGALKSIEPFGTLLLLAGKSIPYIMIIISFTLIYLLLPNTRVELKSALAGGIFAGIAWQSMGWLFSYFVMSSAQYKAIYSGFAIVLLFMIWLYFNWLILLLGSKIAFYRQYPELLNAKDERQLTMRQRDRLAIMILYVIGLHFTQNKNRWTLTSLAHRLKLPPEPVSEILHEFVRAGILIKLEDDQSYIPARDIDSIKLSEAVEIIRKDDSAFYLPWKREPVDSPIKKFIVSIDETEGKTLEHLSLKDLLKM
ncbi:MAG: YihY/virulence factor BrkB family protein [Nitrospiraceae bacterium]|nr:YihY/virulence factor BrkB family protein [Nitrospiraceae bacterium]